LLAVLLFIFTYLSISKAEGSAANHIPVLVALV